MNPFVLALLLSLAANGVLSYLWSSAHDAEVTAVAERDQARGDATACSDATEALSALADQRKLEAAAARDAAKKDSQTRAKRADVILMTPPAFPGDACKSAQSRVDSWLAGRSPK